MDQDLNLLIVAADPLARMALASLLDEFPQFHVLGLANPSTVEDTLADLQEDTVVDLLIWDWGWEAVGMAAADFEALEIPVLALLSDTNQAEEAWSVGARAMLRRESTGNSVSAAASAVAQGLIVIDPELASSILPVPLNRDEELLDELTAREMDVLLLLAEGLTNKEIGQRLGISRHTVKFHVNSILSKLHAQSRTEAVVRATRLGLLAL